MFAIILLLTFYYYTSKIFPYSHIMTGVQGQDPGFDPLEIMVEMAPEMFSDSLADITKREKDLVGALKAMLGIMAKVSPQMNMFVIGLQLKVFVGLFVLVLMVMMITGVADLIFQEMNLRPAF